MIGNKLYENEEPCKHFIYPVVIFHIYISHYVDICTAGKLMQLIISFCLSFRVYILASVQPKFHYLVHLSRKSVWPIEESMMHELQRHTFYVLGYSIMNFYSSTLFNGRITLAVHVLQMMGRDGKWPILLHILVAE